MTCQECDQPARSRGLCNLHYHRARRAKIAAEREAAGQTRSTRTRERLDELEWLITGGVWPVEAAKRCGWGQLASAESVARRHDHPVLPAILRELEAA